MKNRVFIFSALLATVFLFSQCQKDDAMHSTYFWTSNATADQSLTLFVDGQSVGSLPYFNISLSCSNDSLKQRALQMNLASGKYRLEAKDSLGQVRSSGTIKISDSGMGSSGDPGDKGGMAVSSAGSDNSCVTVNLFY